MAANVARRRFASQHALTPLAELEPLEEPATIVIGPGPSAMIRTGTGLLAVMAETSRTKP